MWFDGGGGRQARPLVLHTHQAPDAQATSWEDFRPWDQGRCSYLSGLLFMHFFLSNRKKEPPLLCVYSSVYPETHLVAHAVLELTWTSCLNLLGTEFIGMHHIAQVRGDYFKMGKICPSNNESMCFSHLWISHGNCGITFTRARKANRSLEFSPEWRINGLLFPWVVLVLTTKLILLQKSGKKEEQIVGWEGMGAGALSLGG